MHLAASNDDMAHRLSTIANAYGFDSLKAQLDASNKLRQARIGFIGEFSSGKSTLINAVLGESLLPSRSTPTTANVIQIEAVPGLERAEYFCSEGANVEREITADEFAELACGSTRCMLRLRLPPRGLLQPGIQLIDSPGMNALVSGHADITVAQLSKLDGLVVCLHCELGTVPANVVRFLEREEIRSIAHRIVFVLTAADQKAPAAAARVAANMTNELISLTPECPVIVTTRAMQALKGDAEGIADFTRAFESSFIARAETLRQERRATALSHGADLIRTALRAHQESMAYSDDEIGQKLADGQDQLDKLRQLKASHERQLADWYHGFRQELQRAGERFAPVIGRAAPEKIDDVLEQLRTVLEDTARTQIRRYAPDADIPARALPADITASLTSALQAHARYVEHGVNAATMVAVAVVTAGAGTATTAAAEVATATAAAQSTTAVATKQVAKVAVRKVVEAGAESVLKTVLKNAIAELGKTVKAVNPIEVVGEVARDFWNGSEAAAMLPLITARLAEEYYADLLRHLNDTCFRPLEERLQAVEQGVLEARNARTAGIEDFASRRERVARDVRELDRIIEKMA